MASNLTEVAQFTANVPVPDDGDAVAETGLQNMAQALADRGQYLKNRVPDTSIIVPYHVYQDGTSGSGWIVDLTNRNWVCNTGGSYLDVDAFLPNKGTLTGVTVYVAGDSTGGTAYVTQGTGVPTAAAVNVYSRDMSAATAWTDHGSATDTVATEAAMDAAHAITKSGLSVALSTTKAFRVRLQGPAGGGVFIADKFGLLGITAAITFD